MQDTTEGMSMFIFLILFVMVILVDVTKVSKFMLYLDACVVSTFIIQVHRHGRDLMSEARFGSIQVGS